MSSAPHPPLSDGEKEEYERQIFDLRQLLEVSKSLNSTLDYNALIDAILYAVMGQFNVLKAGLFARKGLDTPAFGLHRNHKGFEVDRSVDYSIPDDHPAIRMFERLYGCYTLKDIEGRIGNLAGLGALVALAPSLVIPLKAKGLINGLIVIGDRIDGHSDFSALEREYLVDMAAMASIAINNSFLFEMTTTDMMTRLKLKHYFYTVLTERMEFSRVHSKATSIMMLDIDHFKRFNDTHGHQCGDAVLKAVARTVRRLVRTGDVAARYGGEEFCVLLPDTDARVAHVVAERVRIAISGDIIEYEGKELSVTVSIGIAQFDPARDLTAKSFVDRADQALYASKSGGRNRSTVAD